MNTASIFVGTFAAVIGLLGLFVASRAVDDGMYIFGLLLFAFAILLDFHLIKRHFDVSEEAR